MAARIGTDPPSLARRWLVTLLVAWSCIAGLVRAAEPGEDRLRASLITIGPGDAIYEKFGHNAIWLHDPSQPPDYRDLAFHYGLFQFDSTFLFRFIQRDLRYSIGAFDYQETVEGCRRDNRTVRVQELNLTPTELQSLRQFLHWNSRTENAEYDYDYYLDNCSTRVRGALSKVTGDELRQQAAEVTRRTLRGETRRLLKGSLIAYTAVDFMNGPLADRRLSQWDLMFLPEVIAHHLPLMRRGDGRPMIVSDNVVFTASRPLPPAASPRWTPRYLALGLAMAALLLLCRRWRRPATTLIIAWCLLTGLSGLFLLYCICFSAHWVTAWNLNFLHASPLALFLAFCAPGVLRTGSRQRAAALVARIICILSAAAALAALVLQWPQRNGPFIAWLLPVNLAVAIILSKRPPTTDATGLETKAAP